MRIQINDNKTFTILSSYLEDEREDDLFTLKRISHIAQQKLQPAEPGEISEDQPYEDLNRLALEIYHSHKEDHDITVAARDAIRSVRTLLKTEEYQPNSWGCVTEDPLEAEEYLKELFGEIQRYSELYSLSYSDVTRRSSILKRFKKKGEVFKYFSNKNNYYRFQLLNKFILQNISNPEEIPGESMKDQALIVAAQQGDLRVIEYLLKNGATIEATDSREMTPILIAAERGDRALVMRLVDLGASVNRKDEKGRTPLILAAMDNDIQLIEFLIQREAEVDAVTSSGHSALFYAELNGHFPAQEKLKKASKEAIRENPEISPADIAENIHNGLGRRNFWMQYMDRSAWKRYGKWVFDRGLHGKQTESGFLKSLEAAHIWAHETLIKKEKITSKDYQDLHKIACAHFSGQALRDGTLVEGDKVGAFRSDLKKRPFATFETGYPLEKQQNVLAERAKALQLEDPLSTANYLRKIDESSSRLALYYPVVNNFEEIISDLFEEFQKRIEVEEDPEQKLYLIAELFQKLELLHPFPDGQGRTDLLMLSLLLCRHGFNPPILDDPYVSSWMSTKDWVEYLKNGMKVWGEERSSHFKN